MEAAVFRGVGNPLSIERVEAPSVRPGDLLIKVEYCGICGSDLHATEAGALVVPDGQILGHEFTGTVVETGGDVGTDWKVGDHVTAVPVNACADCGRQCRLGMGIHCPNNIITGFGAPGAYAEYIRVDAGNALRLPQGLSFREGATAEPLSRRPSCDRQGGHAARHQRAGDRRRPHRPLVHDLRPASRAPATWW